MQRTFQIISTATFILSMVVIVGESTTAQDSEKKTIEPVFRVPKLKNRKSEDPRASVQPAPERGPAESVVELPVNRAVGPKTQPAKPKVVPAPAVAPPVARVADAGEMAIPDKRTDALVPENILASEPEAHPLDRAIEIARGGLDGIRQNVADYTAILVKRERVDGRLSEPNYMKIKIRNSRIVNGREVPFSIYMKFLKPRACAGREVIWVAGRNNNNLIAHETGALLRFKNFHLEPTGFLAMKGNLHPIYDAGLENLILKLIEKAERDRKAGTCDVEYTEDAQINKRPCSLIKVVHPERRHPYEFHVAKVYIDKQLQLPVRYESLDWPDASGRAKIMEQYTYFNIRTNVGLTDADFDVNNPAYNFAR